MDEKVLYIIFIVLWLLYSFFGKKKKAETQKRLQRTQQVEEEKKQNATEYETVEGDLPRQESFKTLFEKMILGDEFVQPADKKEEFVQEVVTEPDDAEISKIVAAENIPNVEAMIHHADLVNKEEEEPEADTLQSRPAFNLRQAVIHSVILQKPYN